MHEVCALLASNNYGTHIDARKHVIYLSSTHLHTSVDEAYNMQAKQVMSHKSVCPCLHVLMSSALSFVSVFTCMLFVPMSNAWHCGGA